MPTLEAVSPQDVVRRLGVKLNELLQIGADEDAANNGQLLAAVESANATIYGYLRARYTLPLETRDASLTLYGTYLVQYDLASRRPGIFSEADTQLRADAIKFLEGVSTGKIQLLFPLANRNEASAPQAESALVTVGGDVDPDDYPSATNQSWFAKW